MGRVLADRADEVARELANSPTAGREGLIQDDEAARIERFCLSADILSLDLSILEPAGSRSRLFTGAIVGQTVKINGPA